MLSYSNDLVGRKRPNFAFFNKYAKKTPSPVKDPFAVYKRTCAFPQSCRSYLVQSSNVPRTTPLVTSEDLTFSEHSDTSTPERFHPQTPEHSNQPTPPGETLTFLQQELLSESNPVSLIGQSNDQSIVLRPTPHTPQPTPQSPRSHLVRLIQSVPSVASLVRGLIDASGYRKIRRSEVATVIMEGKAILENNKTYGREIVELTMLEKGRLEMVRVRRSRRISGLLTAA